MSELNEEDELRQINSDLAWWQAAFPRVLGFTFRIDATIHTTGGGTVSVSGAFRDDIVAQIDAAVKAERERCAERFANHDSICMKHYAKGWRHDVYDAIRKGEQP
jgi:hypothetical protein